MSPFLLRYLSIIGKGHTGDRETADGEEKKDEEGAPQPLDDVAVDPVKVAQEGLAQQATVR